MPRAPAIGPLSPGGRGDRRGDLTQRHKLRFIYRRIIKRQFAEWTMRTFGPGVAINPHAMAFPLVARVVDEYLHKSPER
ncbi:MAG TPA: hypothetical protein VHE61_17825, partial [Opitutaceae bacterium]|nr:hypothetical protein [Opitutaceae bacterium]